MDHLAQPAAYTKVGYSERSGFKARLYGIVFLETCYSKCTFRWYIARVDVWRGHLVHAAVPRLSKA